MSKKKTLDGNPTKNVLKQDAEVVKLVDAVDSKSTTSNGVPVRFRPSVPFFLNWRKLDKNC